MSRAVLAVLLLVALAMGRPLPALAADTPAPADSRKGDGSTGEDEEAATDPGDPETADESDSGTDEDDSEDEDNPHLMVLPDGKLDMDKCGYCHADDNKTLERSPEDTCTNCHDVAVHGGSLSHSRTTPPALGRRLALSRPGGRPFPVTDKGGVYCATCHVSHDADGIVDGYKWLPSGCEESTTPFSLGVRKALEKYRDRIASPEAAHFVKEGTRLLRLPACDGQLCAHCHGDLR